MVELEDITFAILLPFIPVRCYLSDFGSGQTGGGAKSLDVFREIFVVDAKLKIGLEILPGNFVIRIPGRVTFGYMMSLTRSR